MSVLGKLLNLIYTSIFLYGDAWYRHGSLFLNFVFLIISILMIIRGAIYTIIVLAIVSSLYIMFKAYASYPAALILSSIPATWLALTSLIFTGVSLGSLLQILQIFLRTIAISITVLLCLLLFNPIELSVYLCRLRPSPWCLYPIILWRTIPLIMKEGSEALVVMSLKKEKAWKALAITILSSLERAEAISQVHSVKLHRVQYSIKFSYSARALAITTLAIATELFIYVML